MPIIATTETILSVQQISFVDRLSTQWTCVEIRCWKIKSCVIGDRRHFDLLWMLLMLLMLLLIEKDRLWFEFGLHEDEWMRRIGWKKRSKSSEVNQYSCTSTEDLHFNFFSNYETMIDRHCACAHAPIERKEEKRLSYSGEWRHDESSINLMRKTTNAEN